SALCRFLISENYYIRSDSACQCFFFKTFAVNPFDILFFAPFRQAQLIIIHAFQRMSTPFFNFFHFISASRFPSPSTAMEAHENFRYASRFGVSSLCESLIP
ncbi:MAG: hypothetical protein IJY52_03530, partial [Anaerotignum sp.]|nr:hypothetical protein [Anaerotignum sp.]